MSKTARTNGTTVAVPVSSAGVVVLAAANSSRKGLWISNPPTNTGRLYFNLSDTNPTATLSEYLNPGDSYEDTRETCYQGIVSGLYSIAGPQNIAVTEQS